MRFSREKAELFLVLLLLVWSELAHGAEQVFPGADWECETNGLPRATTQELESYLHTLDTTALVVVQHGRIIYQYGDITQLSYLASARKSVLAMLYGYPAAGYRCVGNYTSKGRPPQTAHCHQGGPENS